MFRCDKSSLSEATQRGTRSTIRPLAVRYRTDEICARPSYRRLVPPVARRYAGLVTPVPYGRGVRPILTARPEGICGDVWECRMKTGCGPTLERQRRARPITVGMNMVSRAAVATRE